MLRITIPFTNEVVFRQEDHRARGSEEIVVNRFDEARATLGLGVNSLVTADIAVFMVNLQCPESVLIHVEATAYARILCFTLSGMLQFRDVVTGSVFRLPENTYHSLWMPPHLATDMVIKGETSLFIVGLGADIVNKLVPFTERKTSANHIRLTTPQMDELIRSVTGSAAHQGLQRILLASRMLQLLFWDLEQLKQVTNPFELPDTKRGDLYKLEQARSLIGENLQSPCSLIELAHRVGLNDFKLKKGFREQYGTTVFGYLAGLRMEKAKEMLTSAKYTVAEVAHAVGYKNAHHFTVAFKKKFGELPSQRKRLATPHGLSPG